MNLARATALLAVGLVAVGLVACRRAGPFRRARGAQSRGALAPASSLDARAFAERVLPVLDRAGCGGGTCHGSGLLPMVFEGGSAPGRAARMFPRVARVVRPGDSAHSPLLARAFGRDHLGGMGLLPESCDARLLAAWIDRRPLPACPARSQPSRRAPRDADEPLSPALVAAFASCAEARCHGGAPGGAAPRMVPATDALAAHHNARAVAPYTDAVAPSASVLFRRLAGDDAHPRLFDPARGPDDPRFRALFAWATQEPEVAETTSTLPAFEAFRVAVQPLIARRGCAVTSCHGNRTNPLTLTAPDSSAPDNFVRLAWRARAGLFPQKPTNELAHGGGRRFGVGRDDDCAARVARAWALGATDLQACPRPPDPPLDRFVAMVQPNLERLTCPRCHWQELAGFRFVARPQGDDVQANYRSLLAHVDVDYPAASSVLQRVREPCMQARMLAWLGGEREPACEVDLRNFRGTFPVVPSESMR